MGIVMVLLRWALLAVAVVLAAWVTPDVDFGGGPLSALVVAALVAAANVVAQLLLRWLPTSDSMLVVAATTLVVNGCAVWLASAFTTRLQIDNIIAAINSSDRGIERMTEATLSKAVWRSMPPV